MKVSKPVLFVFLFAVATSVYLFTSGEKKAKPLPAQPRKIEAEAPTIKPQEEARKGQSRPPDGAWSRDPFLLPFELRSRPEEARGEKTPRVLPEVRLYAIVEGRKGKVAILGEEIVSKGDMIKTGERVAEITDGSVVLEDKGARRIIYMQEVKGGK